MASCAATVAVHTLNFKVVLSVPSVFKMRGVSGGRSRRWRAPKRRTVSYDDVLEGMHYFPNESLNAIITAKGFAIQRLDVWDTHSSPRYACLLANDLFVSSF
jgi:hypothetical protein